MKKTAIIGFLLLWSCLLIAQTTAKSAENCTVNIVQVNPGATVGTLNVGPVNYYCTPCYITPKETSEVLVMVDLVPNTDLSGKRPEFQSVTDTHKQAVTKSQITTVVDQSSDQDCGKPEMQKAVARQPGTYLYETADHRSILMRLADLTKVQIENFGLRLKYPESEGITRIKQLGRYFYLKRDGTPLQLLDGEAQRCDSATDFHHGVAVIGSMTPTMTFSLIDTNGKIGKTRFISYEENFGGMKGLFRVEDENHRYVLLNFTMRELTYHLEKITPLPHEHYFEAMNNGAKGLIRLDINAEPIGTGLNMTYKYLDFFPCGIILATDEKGYHLMDADHQYKLLYTAKSSIESVREDKTGFEFFVYGISSTDQNNRGYFYAPERKIIKPEYAAFGHFNKLGFIRVSKWVIQNKHHPGPYDYTYLNAEGKAVFNNYYWIDEEPDSLGYIMAATTYNKWTYIDEKENNLIGGSYYEGLCHFGLFGLAWAQKKFEDDCGLIDRQGNYTQTPGVVKTVPTYESSFCDFTPSGLAITESWHGDSYGKTYGVVNSQKQILFSGNVPKLFIRESPLPGVTLVTDTISTYLYFKDGQYYTHQYGKIVRPYKNGFAIAQCPGGMILIDSLGKTYRDCMPFEALSDVIDKNLVIVTKEGRKGIVKISTGEWLAELTLDDITYASGVFTCKKGNLSFEVGTRPKDNILPYLKGDRKLYEAVIYHKL